MSVATSVRAIRTVSGWALAALAMLWAVSGLTLAFAPRNILTGDGSRVIAPPSPLAARTYASPGGIIAQSERVNELRLRMFMDRIVWEARGPNGVALFDANTADRISPIDEATARRVAQREFAGSETLRSFVRITRPDREYEGRLPVWRAEFSDGARTRLFISVETGDVVARRTVWSPGVAMLRTLHFVDEQGRADPASLWLRFACGVAGVFAVSLLGSLVLGRRGHPA